MPKEHVEEYIEAIYDIAGRNAPAKTTDVARRMHNAPASVTEVFQSLSENGLVHYEPYRGAALTEKGYDVALMVKRKHRLLEVFLSRILQIDPQRVHEEACRMEHSISEEVGDALCRMLHAPSRCPGGKLIHPCQKEISTCDECQEAPKPAGKPAHPPRKVVPVTDLEPHQEGTIALLRGGRKAIQRLSDMGLTPGTRVTIVRKMPMDGPVELRVRRTSLAVGREIADGIFVQDIRED